MSYRKQFDVTRHRASKTLEVGEGGRWGRYFDIFIMALIVSNVTAIILETVDWLYQPYQTVFFSFEAISVTIFGVEYVGRLWAVTEHPDYQHRLWGRLRYAVSFYMIVDLLAILPFFVGIFVDLRFLRTLRFVRFLRIFKLARYMESLQLIGRVFKEKKDDLAVTTVVGLILLLIASSLMYFTEKTAQPEAFSSIPASIWWGIVTLTTVGYGDVHPITPIGKALGATVATIGIGLIAMPASILAAGFVEAARGDTLTCPHCDEDFIEGDLD